MAPGSLNEWNLIWFSESHFMIINFIIFIIITIIIIINLLKMANDQFKGFK